MMIPGIGLAVISASSTPAPSATGVTEYRAWHKVNPRPLNLPTPIDLLCRGATPAELALYAKNPHKQKFFTIYVNEVGKARMLAKRDAASQFPVGAVIIKEKLTSVKRGKVEIL